MSNPVPDYGAATFGPNATPAIFHWLRFDVPMNWNAIHEAQHVAHLYEIYAAQYNQHPSLYNEDHVDVLHRRIAHAPDVEESNFLDWGKYWTVSWNTGHALRNAFTQSRIKLGENVQPLGWTKANPWGHYDFWSELRKANFPYIPAIPEGIAGELALTGFFWDRYEMQAHVARLQFWAICTAAIADIYGAYMYRKGHNIMYAHYYHASPALIAAHRFYSRIEKQDVQPQSMDYFSLDGFSDTSSEPGELATPLQIEAPPVAEPHIVDPDAFSVEDWAGRSPSWDPQMPAYSPRPEAPAHPALTSSTSLPSLTELPPSPTEPLALPVVHDWSSMPASPASGSIADTESSDGTISSQSSWYPGDVPPNWSGDLTWCEDPSYLRNLNPSFVPWHKRPAVQVDRDHWTYHRMMETLSEVAVSRLTESAAR